jgi:hypothetical protein
MHDVDVQSREQKLQPHPSDQFWQAVGPPHTRSFSVCCCAAEVQPCADADIYILCRLSYQGPRVLLMFPDGTHLEQRRPRLSLVD